MKPFSLYLHIPFCYHKCPYCDFNTYAVTAVPEKEYVTALLRELQHRAALAEWKGRSVQSVYFGGGTPSLFAPASIRKIVSEICRTFPVLDTVEVSLEANPGPLTTEILSGIRDAGVNRISFGSQSFNPQTLKTLGRTHTPEQIEAAVAAAKAVQLTNINLDLIYGVPGQSLDDFKADLRAAIKLDPRHLSAYGLTIEKGTPFFQAVKQKTLILPPEGEIIEMMEELQSFAPSCGYQHYEISNFAVNGKEARHNLAYWNGDDYLGLGAGAHSFNRSLREKAGSVGTRWSNFALPKKYMAEASTKGHADSWRESLKREEAIFEFFFLGLRKIKGVSFAEFEERFGCSIETCYPMLLRVLCQQDMLRREGDSLALTTRGLMLADSVIANFSEPEGGIQPRPFFGNTPG